MTTPNYSNLLEMVLTVPGSANKAYQAFHEYSVMNQWLALTQFVSRNIAISPICTFKGWQAKGRFVKKGEKAIELCMPVTGKKKEEGKDDKTFTFFIHKRNWFALSQTEGEAVEPLKSPEWSKELALKALGLTEVPFASVDGNSQGYRIGNNIAINPVASLPHKTLFHEIAHAVLHTENDRQNDSDLNRQDVREMEAECTAHLCCETLGLPGAAESRDYVQNWYKESTIKEKFAKRIISAVNKILKAGKPQTEKEV